MTLLSLAALLPPLILLILIYRMDKVEKEPKGLIIKLVILGAASTILGIILEVLSGHLIGAALTSGTVLYDAVQYFLGVALMEEFSKYVFLKKSTWKHPAFDYTFDGVVYAVSVSLGFAALENFFYVKELGLKVAGFRVVTSIPGHCIFAIFMGISYGLAKKAEAQGKMAEKHAHLVAAILVPTLIHGFYDFVASQGTMFFVVVFFAFLAILYVVAFLRLRKSERKDVRIFDDPEVVPEAMSVTDLESPVASVAGMEPKSADVTTLESENLNTTASEIQVIGESEPTTENVDAPEAISVMEEETTPESVADKTEN